MKKLYEYQQELVDRAEKSTALFWDMGTGKTITSLGIFNKFDEVRKLYVIAPKSMLSEWMSEFENQCGGKATLLTDVRKGAKKLGISFEHYLMLHDIDCVVVNYEMMWRIDDYGWLNNEWMIIADESHRIKNPNSKAGRYMKFLKVKTEYKICLTGTPQSKGYIDYYNQLFFLGLIDLSMTEFKERYCVYQEMEYSGRVFNELVGYRRVDEFEKLYLDKCEFLMIERVYEGDQLPREKFIDIPTNRAYERVKTDKVIYYDNDGKVVTDRKEIDKLLRGDTSTIVEQYKLLDNSGALYMGMMQLLNSKNKQDWLRDFLSDIDDRVVIFYNFNVELHSLREILESLGRPYSEYNGAVKDFEVFKREHNGVILCNYMSGSVGINDLVISNIFVAYSPARDYINWEQSKKRINRNGQTRVPLYYFLRSGMENDIYATLSVGKSFDDNVFIKTFEKDLIL